MSEAIRLLVKQPGRLPELTAIDEGIWQAEKDGIIRSLAGGEVTGISIYGNYVLWYAEHRQRDAAEDLNVVLETDPEEGEKVEVYGPVVLTRLDQTTGEPISLMQVEDLPPELQIAFFGVISEDWVC